MKKLDFPSKSDFLGIPFDNVTMDEAVARLEQFIEEGTPRKVFGLSSHLYVWSRSNPELQRTYETSDLLTVDGMGVYWASRLLSNPAREMVSAVLLMFRIIERAAEKGYKLYLLGTKEDILLKAVGNLRQEYPTLNIVGWHNGYFSAEEEPRIVEEIAEAKPDILFIGMTSPLKERFMERNLPKLGVPVCMGVGGGVDVVAGVYKLAPGWMRKAGVEWLYRLIQEPRRMWKRYATTHTLFACLVLKAFIKQRLILKHNQP